MFSVPNSWLFRNPNNIQECLLFPLSVCFGFWTVEANSQRQSVNKIDGNDIFGGIFCFICSKWFFSLDTEQIFSKISMYCFLFFEFRKTHTYRARIKCHFIWKIIETKSTMQAFALASSERMKIEQWSAHIKRSIFYMHVSLSFIEFWVCVFRVCSCDLRQERIQCVCAELSRPLIALCLHYNLNVATMFWFLHWTKIKWHLKFSFISNAVEA